MYQDKGFSDSINGWGIRNFAGGKFSWEGSGNPRRIDFEHLNPFQS